jgi:vancomycin aglycone glucosyltransferase
VYAGFGSMTTKDPARLTATVLDAAAQAGCRLVLARGWTGLGGSAALPHWCHIVDETPHHLLFPRMRAVVHHGGAGTTTAAARAGVPQIVVPHVLDQFYWAERVRKLGLGPEPVAANQVAVKGLAERLRAAPSFGPRAAGFGRGIRGRDGVEAAAGAIEAIAGGEPLGMGPYFSLGSSR